MTINIPLYFVALVTVIFCALLPAFAGESHCAVSRAELLNLVNEDTANQPWLAELASAALALDKRVGNPEELSATYKTLIDLFDTKNSLVSKEQRIQLVRQILMQAADPCTINQGHHNTCALAALEACAYQNHPALAAKIIAQVATTGFFVDASGGKIAIDGASLGADAEARRGAGMDRSYASQLFQLAAANAYWQCRDVDPRGIHCAKGAINYVQKVPSRVGDTGERLIIGWSGDAVETIVDEYGMPLAQPALSLSELQKVSDSLMLGKILVIGNNKLSKRTKYLAVRTLPELRKVMQRLHDQSLSVVAVVNSNQLENQRDSTPDWSAAHLRYNKIAGGEVSILGQNAWHAVRIAGYDGQSESVSVDNFWGAKNDHLGQNAMPLSQLFASMQANN